MAEGLKVDPAIEKWAHLRENTHLYFSFNKRNTRRSLFWGIAIPVGLTILAYQTDRKWNFSGAQTKEDLSPKKD
ncbi:hypothetical protein G6F57_000361 [Rhizopus arrhizus]|uniref:NADH-ubiquinone oxidoreductase B15 subunit n=3 Tax=Rhizopus TaxID=4842 RepID=I1BXM7_RHIO9|nr:hypothetical protein RO3G_05662 [Rhizopus delemar RA 99-880]KAG0746628.1 hypothetical protein G6F23_003415 [Rhizopus arrhizus]KAG1053832.1 hypothetical protein G6F43_004117 [Rhizopus delemar]KAG1245675.1 hypothetical protein G6F68_014958 [Rhizopus microsporus]KAG0767743.1 hypothetical protein G6F24_002528 [Rhizopus arrhizus]|eukprot:EIE80957.1 hypothetical protein RO3G_05662 [Rhizopus delemar RA 99-880]